MTFEEAATDLGYMLLPWQVNIGNRILRGENVTIMLSKQAGKNVFNEVLDYALEHSA
jgi:hypothetical protein